MALGMAPCKSQVIGISSLHVTGYTLVPIVKKKENLHHIKDFSKPKKLIKYASVPKYRRHAAVCRYWSNPSLGNEKN